MNWQVFFQYTLKPGSHILGKSQGVGYLGSPEAQMFPIIQIEVTTL